MDKLKALFQSRKFWALIASLAGIAAGVASGALPVEKAYELGVAALGVYIFGTGLEDSGR